MRILIINLTRLGDIIQSLGLIKGLKNLYQNAEIDFLAISSFSGILNNFDHIHEIITLDDTKLVDQIETNFWDAYIEIHKKVEYLNEKHYDLLINPVISIQSSYLAFLIQANKKRGMVFTKNKEQGIYSDWSSYLLANQHHIGEHSINLVNIFAGTADSTFTVEDYQLKKNKETDQSIKSLIHKELFSDTNELVQSIKIIGIHIGASQSNKCWESKYFKDLMIRLSQNNQYRIILFGGYKEVEISDYFNDFKHSHFFNWIGKFNLNELISAISQCHLFICNDTGPMHIAAACNVPVINLSLGPVSMWETGPYTMKSIVIQANIDCHPCNFNYLCPHYQCHHQIRSEHVLKAINYYLYQHEFSIDSSVLYWKAITDTDSFIHWAPLFKREISKKEYLFEAKRAVWSSILMSKNQSVREFSESFMIYLQEYYIIIPFDFQNELRELNFYQAIITKIINFLKEIIEISKYQKNNLDKIKIIWSNVKNNKLILFNQAQSYSVFYDWFLYISFSESSSDEGDLISLCQLSLERYDLINAHITKISAVLTAH